MHRSFYPQSRLLWLWLICWSLFAFVLMLVLAVLLPKLWGVFIGAAVLGVGLVWLRLLFHTMVLHVDGDTLALTFGLVFHGTKRLGIKGLQGVVVYADVLSRMLNMRVLVLRMAGFRGIFPGLSPTDAQTLGDYLSLAAFEIQPEDAP